MADMLSTGVSGLLAFQRALDTTSHNIANANTDGYNRQTVNFATRRADQYGNGWVGTGVNAVGIRRLYEQALADQMRGAGTSLQQLDVFATYAERVDNLFSDSSTGLATSLQQFTNSIETLANSPTSVTARQVLLSQAQNLVNRFKSYQSSLASIDSQISSQLTSEAATVTTLARNIAAVNEQIVEALGMNQQPPNDLLDQRDALISQLAGHISVNTTTQDNGAVNVFAGSGQALVTNTSSASLVVVPGEFDRSHVRLQIVDQGAPADVTNIISGGQIGGLLQFRAEMLDPAMNSLGQIAVTLGTMVNQLHAQGLDLNGDFGTDLFALGSARALASSLNGSSASVAVTRTDVSALTTGDYQMRYNGTSWSLMRADTGASVAMTGAGTVGSPFIAEGLSIVVSGAAVAGDAFQIQPTRDVVSGMRVAISGPEKVAAAAAVLTGAAIANTGSGAISAGQVANQGGWVRGNYTLRFTAANAWQVTDASNAVVATGAYTAGGNIDFNGMRVSVTGAPATGDQFTIADNSNGSGDSRNARALADLFDLPVINGNTVSISASVGRLVGQIGVLTSQSQIGRDAQSVVLEDATAAVQNVSGVNLDEEAAALVRYQQAYQAAARVIAAANSMFDTLIEATRR